MNADTLKSQIAEINQMRDDAIEELASAVRARYVIAACKDQKLRFISAMGAYFFVDSSGTDLVSAAMAAKHGYNLQDAFAALDLAVGDMSLGDFVNSYDPEDV